MKYKTTAKELRNEARYIRTVKAGYCDLQTLLRDVAPVAYTCGVYGWNFDVYYVNGINICTGYRGMVGERANNISEYEERARELEKKCTFAQYDELKAARAELLREFCEQA